MPQLTGWQKRLFDEQEELARKITTLTAYIVGPMFVDAFTAPSQRKLLRKQLRAMMKYERVLRARIVDFRGEA